MASMEEAHHVKTNINPLSTQLEVVFHPQQVMNVNQVSPHHNIATKNNLQTT